MSHPAAAHTLQGVSDATPGSFKLHSRLEIDDGLLSRCRGAVLSTSVPMRRAAVMRFGLLCSARATGDAESAMPGQGLRDWLEFNEQAERLGFFELPG